MQTQIAAVLALICAAPLVSQTLTAALDPRLRDGNVEWFQLSETMDQVRLMLGPPVLVADFGNDYQSWQYRFGESDGHEFSHVLVFRRSDRTLMSVTRTYEHEQNVDALFPEAESRVHSYPSDEKRTFSIRTRRLTDGRVLMSIGTAKPGQPTGQIVLMRAGELRFFYPSLSESSSRMSPKMNKKVSNSQ